MARRHPDTPAGQSNLCPRRQRLPPNSGLARQLLSDSRLYGFFYPRLQTGTGLATVGVGRMQLRGKPLSLSGILAGATSGIKTNSTALSVVSSNVSNVDTTGYVKRTANMSTLDSTTNGVTGVEVSDISRTVSKYLDQETYTSLGTSNQYDTENTLYDQVSSYLGQVGDGTSLASELSDITTALATASQSSSLDSSKSTVVSSLKNYASKVSTLYTQLSNLRNSVSDEVSTSVGSINALTAKISSLNTQIQNQTAMGNDATGLCDQRDSAIQSLAQIVDIRTVNLGNGSVKITTTDGTLLVGDSYAVLSYSGGDTSTGYDSIELSYANVNTGKTSGVVDTLDQHVTSGSLKGLLTMRDTTIGQLQSEVGALAQSSANAYNSVSNQYSSYPPPQTMTGRQTGLTNDESLNTSGTTTIALTDSSGTVEQSYSFDFSGMSMDSVISEINSNLSGVTASYDDGRLVISADDSTKGIVIDSSANTGTTDFSTFFGLNDLFQTSIPSQSSTGLSSSSAVNATGSITLTLKSSAGAVIQNNTVSVTSGESISDLLTDLSAATGNIVTFTMNSDGSVSTSYASGYSSCTLTTTADSTERGSTGISLTEFLGIGDNVTSAYAAQFTTSSGLSSDTLPIATVSIGDVGTLAISNGDSAGAIALQNVETTSMTFRKAGGLAATTTTLSNYANAIYQDVSTRSSLASDNYSVQSDRLTEAQKLQSNAEGVNLDEELANMVVYQQAYNASAKLLTTYSSLFDTLLEAAQ